MTVEVDLIVDGMRASINSIDNRMSGVETELRKLGDMLRALIKMEGDVRVNDAALKRIGTQVDGHEKRLHKVEIHGATQKVEAKYVDQRLAWLYGLLAAGIGAGAATLFNLFKGP